MAYTAMDTPAEFFGAGYDLATHKVSVETNDVANSNKTLAQLSDADGDKTTGKTQQVCLALLEMLYQKWLAVALADRAADMSITRQSSVDDAAGTRTVTYIASVKVDASSLTTVRPEA